MKRRSTQPKGACRERRRFEASRPQVDPRVLCSTSKSKQQHQVSEQLWHTFDAAVHCLILLCRQPPLSSTHPEKRANMPNDPVDHVISSQPMMHVDHLLDGL